MKTKPNDSTIRPFPVPLNLTIPFLPDVQIHESCQPAWHLFSGLTSMAEETVGRGLPAPPELSDTLPGGRNRRSGPTGLHTTGNDQRSTMNDRLSAASS